MRKGEKKQQKHHRHKMPWMENKNNAKYRRYANHHFSSFFIRLLS